MNEVLRRYVLSAAVAGLVTLGGCVVDQKKEVALYRSVLDKATTAPTTAPFVENEALSLNRALELANEHNESLAIKGEDYVQALIDKDLAAAAFLPTVSLSPIYTRSQQSSRLNTSSDSTFDVPASAQMNVFNGFRDVAGIKRAAATIDQRRAVLLDLQATVLLNVSQTYYQIIRSEQEVVVLKNSLALQDERVRDIEARQKAGLARPLDVAQTQAQAAGTRVSLVQAQSDVRNGRTTLAFLTGSAVDDSVMTDGFVPPSGLPTSDALIEVARRHREDLRAAEAAVAAAEQGVKAAVGEYYPSVTINFEYFLKKETMPTDSKWLGLLQANVPIFSAGTIEAHVRIAWSLLRQAELVRRQTERQVVEDVRKACQDLQTSEQRMHELAIQVAAAQEALRQADRSYAVGLATNLERLTAQDSLLSAQLSLTSDEFTHKVAYLNVLRVTGQLSTRVAGEPTTQSTTQPTSQGATAPTTQATTRPTAS